MTATGQPSAAAYPAGWYPDTLRRHELRYWDGQIWTEHVADQGQASTDPLQRAAAQPPASASAPAPASAAQADAVQSSNNRPAAASPANRPVVPARVVMDGLYAQSGGIASARLPDAAGRVEAAGCGCPESVAGLWLTRQICLL